MSVETLREAGVAIARTKEGFDLPIIDITNPRFAIADDPASVAALREAAIRNDEKHARIPTFLLRWMLKSAARQSRLMRAMFASDSTFLDSISTYVMKLGAGNLVPPYDTEVDQKFAASPNATMLRLRMQHMAKLIAAHVAAPLKADPHRPLHMIEIAGGPAMDAINALLLLTHSSLALLQRPIVLHVLDLGEDGPFFGRAVLAELQKPGGPLHGLDITFQHQPYDWRDTSLLEALVVDLVAQDAITIAASEGGLFEYGSDADIIANLRVLRLNGRGVPYVVGSVTRAEQAQRRVIAQSRIKVIPRGLEIFAPLATQAGFTITEARQGAWSDQVVLRSNPPQN